MIQALALTLVCYGMSNTPSAETSYGSVRTEGRTTTAEMTTYGRNRTNDRLTVEVVGDTVRIKGPPSLTPAFSGRGDDGWRTLTGVSITDTEIRGQISYNWVTRPMVRIDRMSGEIEMRSASLVSGVASFRGDCESVQRDQPRF